MLDENSWRVIKLQLNYYLGEIHLFSHHFQTQVFQQHFSNITPLRHLPTLPLKIDQAIEAIYFPCYPIAFAPKTLTLKHNWLAYTSYTFPNHYVDLQRIGSFAAYLEGFSAKSRSTLKRKLKKFTLVSGGQIDWKEYASVAEMETFFELALSLSAKTYQERLLGAGLPNDPAFKNEVLKDAEHNEARGFILFLHHEPVAYVFSHCNDGIVFYSYVGYDPEAHELSPGTVLQYLILESLFKQKAFKIFDFTEGDGQHKVFFGSDRIQCAKTYFFRNTVQNWTLVLLHYLFNQGVSAIGNLLNQLGIKGKIRKLIRNLTPTKAGAALLDANRRIP